MIVLFEDSSKLPKQDLCFPFVEMAAGEAEVAICADCFKESYVTCELFPYVILRSKKSISSF